MKKSKLILSTIKIITILFSSASFIIIIWKLLYIEDGNKIVGNVMNVITPSGFYCNRDFLDKDEQNLCMKITKMSSFSKIVIIVFGHRNNIPALKQWTSSANSNLIKGYLVFCTDKEIFNSLNNGITSEHLVMIPKQFEYKTKNDLNFILPKLFKFLLLFGIPIVYADSSIIFLRNPLTYFITSLTHGDLSVQVDGRISKLYPMECSIKYTNDRMLWGYKLANTYKFNYDLLILSPHPMKHNIDFLNIWIQKLDIMKLTNNININYNSIFVNAITETQKTFTSFNVLPLNCSLFPNR